MKCAVPEISILTPQKGLKFPRGWVGVLQDQKVKEIYWALLEFLEGLGVLKTIPSMGGGMVFLYFVSIIFKNVNSY